MSAQQSTTGRTPPTTNSAAKTLTTMPPEVILVVFESLTDLRDAVSLARTCQAFGALYKRLQPTICLAILPSDPMWDQGCHRNLYILPTEDQRRRAKYPVEKSKQLYPKAVALFLSPIMKMFRLESELADAQARLSELKKWPLRLQAEEVMSRGRNEVRAAEDNIAEEKENQSGTWTDSDAVRAAGRGEWAHIIIYHCDLLLIMV
jgi:hypothetical protein